jgi:DNA-binding transcriptional ArsR family regulator
MVKAQIVLGPADLARIRLRDSLDLLDEMRFSAHELSMGRAINPMLVGWARRTVAGLGPRGTLLMDVMNSGVVQVSSLGQSAATTHSTIDGALDAILSTPNRRWPRVIQRLLDAGVQPGRPAAVTDGQVHVHQLVSVMRRFTESALTPQWSFMEVTAVARRNNLAQILATHGIDELLNRLHPEISWSPPVLTIGTDEPLSQCTPGCSHDAMREHFPTMTIVAGGRGLILAPSVFATSVAWWASAGDADNPDPVVLTYPVQLDWSAVPHPDGDSAGGSLADLIGSTRSRLLTTILDAAPTTSQLATLCLISPASASEHAAVLRRAGLITSRREGHRVFHEPTALGTALVQVNGRRPAHGPAATLVS